MNRNYILAETVNGKAGPQEWEVQSLTPKTRALLDAVAAFFLWHFGVPPVLTSIVRPDGIHSCNRAFDVRTWDFTKEQIAKTAEFANRSFPYPGHPTCLPHDSGHGFHLHFQSPE